MEMLSSRESSPAPKQPWRNDIPVVLGNDVGCPWITQYDFWRELYYFHKYVGVSNAFALYTATKRSAELTDIDSITGSIEKGKAARPDRHGPESAEGSESPPKPGDGHLRRPLHRTS